MIDIEIFKQDNGQYLCLENNKTYKHFRSIINLLKDVYNLTYTEYLIKWNYVQKEDYVQCQICGSYCDSIGKHLASSKHKKDRISLDEYKSRYDTHEVIGKLYKTYLSDRSKGENNINHKSKTTLLERQQKSPFSIEFWKRKYPLYSDDKLKDIMKIFVDSALSKREFDTRIDYYIKRGFNEDEALQLIKKRQTTFSLDICIDKYGKDDGLKIWLKRQEKWAKNYKKQNFSKISQTLFKEIYKKIKNDYKEIYFAILDKNKNYDESGKNYEYYLKLNDILIKPDFFIKDIKKIIELDGTYYHRKNSENIKREKYRDLQIIKSGYKVHHVLELDFKSNKEKTIKKCIDFILS